MLAEEYLGPYQTSIIEFFAIIVKGFFFVKLQRRYLTGANTPLVIIDIQLAEAATADVLQNECS